MNQLTIGKFIAQKRKEKNLTQEQLSEKLGVSNKTVLKWECGKCMPDYSIVKPLCQELGITVSELIETASSLNKSQILGKACIELSRGFIFVFAVHRKNAKT